MDIEKFFTLENFEFSVKLLSQFIFCSKPQQEGEAAAVQGDCESTSPSKSRYSGVLA
jgi:hypothetical protein